MRMYSRAVIDRPNCGEVVAADGMVFVDSRIRLRLRWPVFEDVVVRVGRLEVKGKSFYLGQ